jgi:hypothetical protein
MNINYGNQNCKCGIVVETKESVSFKNKSKSQTHRHNICNLMGISHVGDVNLTLDAISAGISIVKISPLQINYGNAKFYSIFSTFPEAMDSYMRSKFELVLTTLLIKSVNLMES